MSRQAQRAREGLIAGGDLANAGYTYHATVYCLLDCAPSLDGYVAEVEAGLAFVRRTGNEQIGQWLDSYRWLAGVLRGESSAAAGEAVPADRYADNPLALLHAHLTRAIAAAIFGDPAGLARHTAAAMPLLSAAPGHYPTAVARLLRGLALAGQARAADGDAARRAAGRAGRGDAVAGRTRRGRAGELPAPAAAGRGRAGLGGRRLPRRRAGLRRRAARGRRPPAALAPGPDRRTRGPLLPGPRRSTTPATTCSPRPARTYAGWGATAKVAQLDWAYPALRPAPDATAAARRRPARDLPRAAPRSRPAPSTCSASCPPRRR